MKGTITTPVAAVSLLTASNQRRLTKLWRLSPEGVLARENGEQFVHGRVDRLPITTIGDLAALVADLQGHQALTYGLPRRDGLIGSKAVARQYGDLDVQTRTADQFTFSEGPAVWFVDYDPADGAEPLTPTELRNELIGAVPALATAPMMITASASSHIHHAETGEVLRGARGLHIYVLVQNGSDIPRVTNALGDALWLSGHGRYDISKSGDLLKRCLIDLAVAQPERLDFAGGAVCEAPLVQRRPAPILFNIDVPPFDTRAHVPDISDRRLGALQAEIKRARAPEAKRVQKEWIADHLKAVEEYRGKKASLAEKKQRREALKRAITDHVLSGDFLLTASTGVRVTVAEILADPGRWDEQEFCDPLEPDYRGDHRIAWAN